MPVFLSLSQWIISPSQCLSAFSLINVCVVARTSMCMFPITYVCPFFFLNTLFCNFSFRLCLLNVSLASFFKSIVLTYILSNHLLPILLCTLLIFIFNSFLFKFLHVTKLNIFCKKPFFLFCNFFLMHEIRFTIIKRRETPGSNIEI